MPEAVPTPAPPPSAADSGHPAGTDWRTRVFTSPLFFRLWCAQVVSAMGDWIGLLAIAAAAQRIGAGNGETAIALVMTARIAPGLFLAPVAGVLVDRWDRKKVMVTCDVGRGLTLALLPFITDLWQLLLASLVLEALTMLWSPAKEASVPNLVPPEGLTTANSLSMVAAYGTFPIAALLFSLLAGVAEFLGTFDALSWMGIRQESVAFWFDTLTFFTAALIIWRIPLPRTTRTQREAEHQPEARLTEALRELKDGWRYVFADPVARSVNVGLATGLIGGGMLVPLGPVFADTVLGRGAGGFGLLTTALGMGVAVAVILLTVVHRRLPKERLFTSSLLAAGTALIAAASCSTLGPAAAFIFALGLCAGTVYLLGFTLLQEHTEDALRGRAFGALFTLVRLCVLIAFTVGPFLAGQLDKLTNALWEDATITVGDYELYVPGVRVTLWLAGGIILVAGALALRSVRAGPTSGTFPDEEGESISEHVVEELAERDGNW